MEVLFSKGKALNAYPVKMMFIETQEDLPYPAQSMFVVPKRNFKRAHDRNKLKRRMREAYRLGKFSFYENLLLKEKKMILAFIYISKKQEDYPAIEKSVLKVLTGVLKP